MHKRKANEFDTQFGKIIPWLISALWSLVVLAQPAYAISSNVDAGFNVISNTSVADIAVQSDGNILILGLFDVSDEVVTRVARVTPRGQFDPRFAAVSGDLGVSAMVVQADGKIVLAGSFTMINGMSRNRLARLNTDGSLDDSFNPNVTGAGNGVSVVALAIQVIDGVEHILIGGEFSTLGTASNTTMRTNIARLRLDGSVDTSFASVNPNNDVVAIAVDSNNDVFIAGQFSEVDSEATTVARNVVRLNIDGSLDTDFDSPPLTFLGVNAQILALAVQSNNQLVVGGNIDDAGGIEVNGLVRFDTDGSLDENFIDFPESIFLRSIRALAIQPNGQVLFGGLFVSIDGTSLTRNLARINVDGSLDTSFQPNVQGNSVNVVALSPSNETILIGGAITSVGGITRTNVARLGEDPNQLCLPIQAKNDKIAVVCL